MEGKKNFKEVQLMLKFFILKASHNLNLLPLSSESGLPTYWPSTTSSMTMGGVLLSTFTFSSRMSSGLVEAGFSMAVRQRTCNRWFCRMSLMMPNSSKYPPRPCVPNGSLKEMTTEEMWLRFHVGSKMELANRM